MVYAVCTIMPLSKSKKIIPIENLPLVANNFIHTHNLESLQCKNR